MTSPFKKHHLRHTLSKVLSICLVAVICLVLHGTASAQAWEAAKFIPGAEIQPYYTMAETGEVLIPAWWVLPNKDDTILFFSIDTLLSDDPQPWHIQAPVPLNGVDPIFDGNNTGFGDLVVYPQNERSLLLLEACTSQQRISDQANFPATGNRMNRIETSIDADVYLDVMSSWKRQDKALIKYGDSSVPYGDFSEVFVPKISEQFFNSEVIAFGRLSGKMCMIQLVYTRIDPESGVYQLVELNDEDLRDHRDTIRTSLLHEVPNPDKYYFKSRILLSDTVWNLVTTGNDGSVTLRVTIASGSIVPTTSVLGEGTVGRWYGQGKSRGDNFFPLVIDASRPIIRLDDATVTRGMLEYLRCDDPYTAHMSVIGQALLPIADAAGIERAMTIPDQDGDGIEDVVATIIWYNDNVMSIGTGIYLTGDIQPVSVEEVETPQDLSITQTSSDLIIELPTNEIAVSVDIANVKGGHLLHQEISASTSQPLTIPTKSLPSGAYVCSVTTRSGRFSSTFVVVR